MTVEKKDLDWGSLDFGYHKTDYSFEAHWKDGEWDEGGLITVKHNSDSHPTFAYVLLLLLKNGRKWTKVVPRGQSSELDDLTISSSELCQRPLTMKYLTDENGDTCVDYIESTETAAA